jgi:hypothetical protein
MDLRDRLRDQLDAAPTSILGWLEWTLSWLDQDKNANDALFGDVGFNICAMLGKPAKERVKSGDFVKLLPALKAWITGKTIREMEIALGGTPDADSERQRICPRARELLGALIPRGLSFTLAILTVSRTELGDLYSYGFAGFVDGGLSVNCFAATIVTLLPRPWSPFLCQARSNGMSAD